MNLEYRDGNATSAAPYAGGASDACATTTSASKPTAVRKSSEAGEKLAAEMKVYEQVACELKQKRAYAESVDERCSQVLREAVELFGVAPTWTAFYRETLGVQGCVRDLFKSADEMHAYECSDAHEKVLEMLTVLRSRDLPDTDPTEPQRMITVRIPKSLHDSICQEANDLHVSVNKLCITRMVQRVDRNLIPTSNQKRRGRRPGAEYSKASASAEATVVDSTAFPAS